MSYILILITFALILTTLQVHCHPQCLDFYPPFETQELTFCTMYNQISCCTAEHDNAIYEKYMEITQNLAGNTLTNCHDYIRDILCQECSPYAAHLYDAESTGIATSFPGLCNQFCISFHNVCSDIVPFLTNDIQLHAVSKQGSVKFCDAVQIPDMDYCYPDILDDFKLNTALDRALGGEGDGCLCLEEVATGLRNPLLAVHANDTTHRLYIAEQLGLIHIYLKDGVKIDEPFLDLQKAVLTSDRRADERGLLGLAFHPNYKTNKRLFIHYTTTSLETSIVRISEFSPVLNNDYKVDTGSEKVLLEVDEPAVNHNGGQILFGFDGYLYISLGDGGKGGDPWGIYGNGQNMKTFLGKILRIDVDSKDDGKAYAIPLTNPFVDRPTDTKHEIYAYGIRNIWRCGLDRGDRGTGAGRGRIICGDVGQSIYEEIDIIVKGGNYGWRAKEGFQCYDKQMCANRKKWLEDEVLPIHTYDHKVGKSVTGGHIYRGCLFPNMNGYYIYGDFFNGRLFKLVENPDDGTWVNSDLCLGDANVCTGDLLNTYPINILSFGEDESGEIYMLATDLAKTTNAGGKVYRFVDPSLRRSPSECPLNEEEVIGTIDSNKNKKVKKKLVPNPKLIMKVDEPKHPESKDVDPEQTIPKHAVIKQVDPEKPDNKANRPNVYTSAFEREQSRSNFVPYSLTALVFVTAAYIFFQHRHKIFVVICDCRMRRRNVGGSYHRTNHVNS